MELSNSWILHWNMKIIKNRKSHLTPLVLIVVGEQIVECSNEKWNCKEKAVFVKNTQVRVDKTQDSKKIYDLAFKLAHTHMCRCELNASLCPTNAFCLQLCRTCLMFPFLFTPVWLLRWPQLSFTANPRKHQLLVCLRVQRWDECGSMCVSRVSLRSAVSSPLMKVSFIYLIIYLQDSNNTTPPLSSALSRQEETGQTCQSVVSLLKSCISTLKQVSRQFELDSHIFKPWDVFTYLVDEWVILT